MMWILHGRGVERALHYLDDYLVSGPATQPDCQRDLNTVLSLCGELGFPVAPEKTEGPTTTLTFLGIEIDSVQHELRPPPPTTPPGTSWTAVRLLSTGGCTASLLQLHEETGPAILDRVTQPCCDCGKTRKSFLVEPYRCFHSSAGLGSLGAPQHGCQSGPGMVVHLPAHLEWG